MWLYNGEEYQLPEDASHKNIYGFVYLIENPVSGMKYVGRKFFWAKKFKQVNKKKKRIHVESDWKTYFGSSDALKEEAKLYGEDCYTKTILHICDSKGMANYLETYEIFNRGALLSEEYFNNWVSCKVHANHVKALFESNQSDCPDDK